METGKVSVEEERSWGGFLSIFGFHQARETNVRQRAKSKGHFPKIIKGFN